MCFEYSNYVLLRLNAVKYNILVFVKVAVSKKQRRKIDGCHKKSCHVDTNDIKKVAIFAINSSKCDWLSWEEDTNRQVDFLIKQLHLKGTEKILDLACGFGRHSLEFARRGYDVTGIDITTAYIDYANEQAKKENLNAKFICQDIRTITFDKEFDVVLNMADGAIGYLEDDGENHKIFFCHCESIKKWWKALYGYHEWKLCPNTFPLQVMGCRRKGTYIICF